jgi:hypothetical protein
MFINLSNHPSSKWSEAQTESARQFGDIVDLPFPQVDPNGDETYIARLANEYCQKVIDMAGGKPVAVHLMGEMTLTFALARLLKAAGITCMAATTERVVVENEPGLKTAIFRFVRFRKYE